MIAAEIQTGELTVRIHDERCHTVSQGRMAHMSQIVTDSYRRRWMEGEGTYKMFGAMPRP